MEHNQVGRITAAASSVEMSVFVCLWHLSGVPDVGVALALFGTQHFDQAASALDRVVKQLRRTYRPDLGPEWDEGIRAARRAMADRNAVMHATWLTLDDEDGGSFSGFARWTSGHIAPLPERFTVERLFEIARNLESAAVRFGELDDAAGPWSNGAQATQA